MGIFALDAHYERGSQTSFQTIKSMLSRYLYRGEIDGGQHESLSAFIIKRTNLSQRAAVWCWPRCARGIYHGEKKLISSTVIS